MTTHILMAVLGGSENGDESDGNCSRVGQFPHGTQVYLLDISRARRVSNVQDGVVLDAISLVLSMRGGSLCLLLVQAQYSSQLMVSYSTGSRLAGGVCKINVLSVLDIAELQGGFLMPTN
jgi:hypothetical protein